MSTAEVDPPRLDPSAPPASFSMGRGTLARRLVLQVVALVAVVALILSGLTAFAVQRMLLNQLDGQISQATQQLVSGGGQAGPGDKLNGPGQAFDTVYVAFINDGTVYGKILRQDGQDPVSAALVGQIRDFSSENDKGTVYLQGLGRYRLVTSHYPNGTAVVGRPIAETNQILLALIGLELILTVLAMGGAALGARALIGNSLRPLNRLQSTANQVSRLELDRGDVDLSVRVPPQDIDPRSEVGQVGIAFNHMLGNVAGALAVRQSSERKLSQFVADASHELRNPLAAIRGYAELTRRSREELPPDTSFAMARVESEADRMSHLVEDLLLLARLDSGPNLEAGPTDLTETVLNAISDARVAGPDHRWSLSLPPEPVVVQGDRHRIHQIVANLLANARTHTPPGTTVEAGVRIEGPEAVISVTDNGPGIPPEIGSSVFERFTRADTSRARADGHQGSGSTGLGLAIVAAVVDAHHGRVWVDSVPGRTQFSVALPIHPTAEREGQLPHDPRL